MSGTSRGCSVALAIVRCRASARPKQSCAAAHTDARYWAIATAHRVCLAADCQQSTITSCVGMERTEGRRDLDHRAVAWPGVAVISSLPAHALLPFVRSTSLPEAVDDFCFNSLRRLLAAATSRVEQADGGLGHGCPIPPEGEALTRSLGPRSLPQIRETGSERSVWQRSLARLDPGIASAGCDCVAVVVGHGLA